MIEIVLSGLVYVFVYMSLWFVVSLISKRNDVADLAWGLGFVGMSWLMYSKSQSSVNLLMAILVSIWGSRLAFHIWNRLLRRGEDYRYVQWRNDWGKWFYVRSYLQVFLLQGIFMWMISMSVMIMTANIGPVISIATLAGVGVWVMGFWFESTADKQLAQFVRDPKNKGRLMQTGLWRYSRHPNYFGEISMWWGLWLMTLPYQWIIALVSPLTITFLITKVSGVPLLEKKYEGRPDWEEYKKKTSVLIPWYRREK